MKLHTEVKIETIDSPISYRDKLLFLGSCFSGNIGNKFSERLFNSLVNPFGVIFNPISIFKLLERAIDKKYFTKEDWIFRNEKWLNLDLHGELSYSNLEEAITNSNRILDEVNSFISNTDYIFLTFGTSWVYTYKQNQQLVANCHKIPQKEFDKKILSIPEIVSFGNNIINKLQAISPNILLIFTVSPVRHWSDGAHNNNLSKSVLHLSIQELLKNNKTQYFPSYELVIDELRDYRFYKRDLVHPNEVATDFVWEKLSDNWISDETQKVIIEIEKLISASNHRPFNVQSDAHQKFIKKTISKLDILKNENKNLNFEKIKMKLTQQIEG